MGERCEVSAGGSLSNSNWSAGRRKIMQNKIAAIGKGKRGNFRGEKKGEGGEEENERRKAA